MANLKIGDRVRVTSPPAWRGRIGTIAKANETYAEVCLTDGNDKLFMLDCLELAPTTYIVARVGPSGPTPALKPHAHASSVGAAGEARRLAEANPGAEFAVYAKVAGYIADKPTAREVAA